ncbi:MAG: peptidylprolyl isomerase [Methylotenera sp.]|jgi:FKBP-type peptidyl-prolyl cis-trans isomerase SlyD|nr:peptidylprolyl isomerase [Methylotenera sp.]
MQVTRPCVVSLRWRLEDAQGQLIDELTESMEFLVGGDDLFAKVETALEGQEAGFETDIALQPEEAFGDYDSSLVCFEARALFPKDVEPGMQFEGLPEGAATEGMPAEAVYTVTEVYPEHVVLDGNHPLAGIGLRMHLTLLDVRAATEEEVQAGSVGEPIFMVQTGAPPDEPIH